MTPMFGGRNRLMTVIRMPLGPVEANCYVVSDEKSGEGALVDVGGFSEELLCEIKNAEIKKLKYILCTHGHFDHISGIPKLKKHFPEAKITISTEDAPLLSDTEKSLADYFGVYQPHFKADLTVKDGDELFLGNKRLRVLFTPGHSQGSVCYICDEDETVFSGDTLFKFTVGRTDLWGGNADELSRSLEKLMSLPDSFTVYTGHNIQTTIGSERVRNRFFRRK